MVHELNLLTTTVFSIKDLSVDAWAQAIVYWTLLCCQDIYFQPMLTLHIQSLTLKPNENRFGGLYVCQ